MSWSRIRAIYPQGHARRAARQPRPDGASSCPCCSGCSTASCSPTRASRRRRSRWASSRAVKPSSGLSISKQVGPTVRLTFVTMPNVAQLQQSGAAQEGRRRSGGPGALRCRREGRPLTGAHLPAALVAELQRRLRRCHPRSERPGDGRARPRRRTSSSAHCRPRRAATHGARRARRAQRPSSSSRSSCCWP